MAYVLNGQLIGHLLLYRRLIEFRRNRFDLILTDSDKIIRIVALVGRVLAAYTQILDIRLPTNFRVSILNFVIRLFFCV